MVFGFSTSFNQVSLDESDLKRLFLSCLLHSSSMKLMFSLDRGGLYRPCNVPLGVEVRVRVMSKNDLNIDLVKKWAYGIRVSKSYFRHSMPYLTI